MTAHDDTSQPHVFRMRKARKRSAGWRRAEPSQPELADQPPPVTTVKMTPEQIEQAKDDVQQRRRMRRKQQTAWKMARP